jgi:hypothetical protein
MLPGTRSTIRGVRVLLAMQAVAVFGAGCSGLPTEAADDAEERLTGSRLPQGERITRASCGELGDGNLECEVQTDRGNARCTANGRDGKLRDLSCTKPR